MNPETILTEHDHLHSNNLIIGHILNLFDHLFIAGLVLHKLVLLHICSNISLRKSEMLDFLKHSDDLIVCGSHLLSIRTQSEAKRHQKGEMISRARILEVQTDEASFPTILSSSGRTSVSFEHPCASCDTPVDTGK